MNSTTDTKLGLATVIDGTSGSLLKIAGFGAALTVLYYVLTSLFMTKARKRLPPGPKPMPIIGNMLDMPPKGKLADDYWIDLGKTYGPLASLSVFGQTIIVVSDAQVANEMLAKRSANTSDRPRMVFASEMVGLEDFIVMSPANKQFAAMRKVAHTQLGSTAAIRRWSHEINVEVRRCLLRTLESPQDFLQNARIESAAIILRIVYGYNVRSHEPDMLVDKIEKVMDNFSKAAIPGEWLVDLIPALKVLPEWFPGAAFKRTARLWKSETTRLAHSMYCWTKQQTLSNKAPLSLVSGSLNKRGSELTTEEEGIIERAAMSMYAGGAETTATVMEMFFLAMALFPAVQRKAQEAIDAQIGTDRLPDESDSAKLPYIDAILKELIRWQPIGGVSIPHTVAEDDTCYGYDIPKGSTVLVNILSIFHDPAIHSEPAEFRPERFLGEKPEPDPLDQIWGWGRRICPGRHLAMANMWLQVAMTLAVFDIRAIKGQEPQLKFNPGVVRHPAPFKVKITARSPQHERLIRTVEIEHPPVASDLVEM